MKKYSLEFSVGVFVLVGLVCLGYLTIKLGKLEIFGSDSYTLSARFTSATGLKTGSNVEIAGVQVGRVTRIGLDDNYMARVTMQIRRGIRLSDDSIAAIKTSGLIGDRYISISIGGSSHFLADGSEIEETQSAIDIEELISKFVFGGV
jgi:phospholipid/cholesterol/gamma-HCH transport system substrate-binding protein